MLSRLRLLLAAVAVLLLPLAPAGAAEPSWRTSPEPIPERPVVEAPPGGWWSEHGVYANVHGPASERATVRRLADHAARSVPVLAERLGLPAGARIDVYLAPDQDAFERVQPGTPPDWADGTAWPRHGLVFLRAPSARPGTAAPLEQVLDHEIVHVMLGQAFAPRPVPRWLQEGMAQFYAGEVGPELARDLARGTLGRGLLRLDELTAGFPADPIRARLAYAQSADFVAWLAQARGDGALRALVREMARGEPVDVALRSATGMTIEDADADWRSRLEDGELWLPALLDAELWWLLGAVALAVAAWRVRKRYHRRLRRAAAEEELLRRLEEERRFAERMHGAAWRPPGSEWTH